MKILGTEIHYDTIKRTSRKDVFVLCFQKEEVARMLLKSDHYLVRPKKGKPITAVWDKKASSLRISEDGKRIPEESTKYASARAFLERFKKFSKGKQPEYSFEITPELQRALDDRKRRTEGQGGFNFPSI